jgi:hypothetical protein
VKNSEPILADRILAMIRRALERGQAVEIDGLGTFRPEADGTYEFSAQTEPQVFIAYVEEDLLLARRLRDRIAAAGCSPWMDKDKLIPGQNWPRAIRRAIEISDTFVACFSARSSSKRGPFQSELRWALHCAQRMPLEETFVVPVRFEACAVPRQLQERVQYVDLFPDWEAGVKKVIRAVKAGPKPGCRLVQAPI